MQIKANLFLFPAFVLFTALLASHSCAFRTGRSFNTKKFTPKVLLLLLPYKSETQQQLKLRKKPGIKNSLM